MAKDKLSPAQERAIDFIKAGSARQLGALGTEIGKLLAELTAEQMDSKEEAAHWKKAFQTIQAEFRIAVGVMLKEQGGKRLVITRAMVAAMPANTELYLDDHEPGVRVYELRQRATDNGAAVGSQVSRIIRSH